VGEQSGAFIGLRLEYGHGHEHDRLVQTLIWALRLEGRQELRMVMVITIQLLHSWVAGTSRAFLSWYAFIGMDGLGVVGVLVLFSVGL